MAQTQKKKKKSKRQYTSREDQLQAEKVEEFSRLQYNARKLIRKEAKLVKAFECKKINKKIKPLKDEVSIANESNKDTKSQQRLERLECKLKATKDFDLELLVDVCMQRLGINQLDPKDGKQTNNNKKGEQETNTTTLDSAMNELHQTLIETILQHKKIISILDDIDKKVVTYRNWVTGREKRLRGEFTESEFSTGQKKSKKRKLNKAQSQTTVNDDMSTLFVTSLSGAIPNEMDDDDGGNNNYGAGGYADDFDQDIPKKKNRKGQRARKAKAMAIEARKAGRIWDSSVNWRPKKSKDDKNNELANTKQSSASGLRNKSEVKIADVVDMGKSWKEEGKAHPSWAAREAQKAKAGIAQFAGKKITFDD